MKKNWKRLLFWLIACGLLATLIFVGRANASDNASPWPYVVFVERPVVLEDWGSVEELEAFLSGDDTDRVNRVVATPGNLSGQCEDRAFQLRAQAAEQGKRLETEILTKDECLKYHEYLKYSYGRYLLMDDNNSHVVCKAVVGNEWHFIEPTNDKHWIAYYLD